jgi:hypothetical protein
MPRFMLEHTHAREECRIAFAAWRGFDSPLRHRLAPASCGVTGNGGPHRLWWTVEAPDEQAALAHLPEWVAERTTAAVISDVEIP